MRLNQVDVLRVGYWRRCYVALVLQVRAQLAWVTVSVLTGCTMCLLSCCLCCAGWLPHEAQ